MTSAAGDTADANGNDDPVLRKRAQAARLAALGQRIGYSLVLLAIVAFAVGLFAGFGPVVTWVVGLSLGLTAVTLAPAIVLGYAVKAADREDSERGLG